MNNNALKAAEVLENNVAEIKEAIKLDNDKMILQTIKRMQATVKKLKVTVKQDAKLKKELAKNIDRSALSTNTEGSDANNCTDGQCSSSTSSNY